MNLIVDRGNTRTKVSRVQHGEVVDCTTMTEDTEAISELARGCDAAIISSVATDVWCGNLDIPTIYMQHDTPLPIGVEYASRNTLGIDRLAAAVGAWRVLPDKPCLVIDSGTCITIDLVLPGRGFVGGNISAGLNMRLRACHEFTARLPLADSVTDMPEGTLGHDTISALQAGAAMGVRYELEGYVRRFAKEYDALAVFLTGGAAFGFDVPRKVTTFVRPYLVAEGLDAILEYNMRKKCKQEIKF